MADFSMDKAVILARGLGTRMRRAEAGVALDPRQQAMADAGVKAMMPIDRPFLDYVLSALADAGYRRVCLVVAPEHDVIRRYYEGLRPRRIAIDYAVQREPKGTADAVAAAEEFAAGDPFLVINADNYYPIEALARLRGLAGCGTALFEQEAMFAGSNIAPERIRQFAVGQIDGSSLLQRIVEKPDEAALAALPRPLWISMNCWRFGPAIFEACRSIRPSKRGEYELPDAVQHLIDVVREPFHVITVRAPVLDLTCRKDVATIAPKLAGVRVDL
ncbi:MAG: sugar phosphate nucleotidyltransferase [Thermoguttaceae bacterium]|jgi:glucose-1-phosphate thymidylyltransferase|nr:sugar phosphate nucleotidyltransferase [Thermoguttaceae bacterium]